MDSRFLLQRARFTTLSSRKRKKPLSVEVKRVFQVLVFTLIILLFGAGLLFFFQTNSAAQKGYELRQMERQNSKLRTENEELKQQVLEAQSFKNLSRGDTVEGMQNNDTFLYVPLKQEKLSRKE